MSSLLRFNGRIDRRGVGLLFMVADDTKTEYNEIYSDTFTCPVCGEKHIRLYEAFRKPRGMWGHWVVFAYNGEEHVPDLSLPIDVERLPKGCRVLSDEECHKYWKSE